MLEKHGARKPVITFKCTLCYLESPGFNALPQQKNTQHGFPIKSAKINPDDINLLIRTLSTNEVADKNLKEELSSFQHFQVDSELGRARHKVFNHAIENLNAKFVNENLDHFFNNLKCAAKVNLLFGFILNNKDNGGFGYFYAHENNTLLDRSTLFFTRDDLAKLKDFLNKTDVIETCSRKRLNTK